MPHATSIHPKPLIIAGLLALSANLSSPSLARSEPGCAGAGPQAPRDIGEHQGKNKAQSTLAPSHEQMNLCDIHFHQPAEHRAVGYPKVAGDGDHRGFVCARPGAKEPAAHHADQDHANQDHADQDHATGCGGVSVGDTIEVHWVFTTCDVDPAPKLSSCFSPLCNNPQLRVEAQVFYLTDGADGEHDFADFDVAGRQPRSLPPDTAAVEYVGSTTGPSYKDACSPYQVTWNVRPSCAQLSKSSLDRWCDKNLFGENHAHGVRPLVIDEALLSAIQ